jgi:hypothetical protein
MYAFLNFMVELADYLADWAIGPVSCGLRVYTEGNHMQLVAYSTVETLAVDSIYFPMN